MSATEPVQFHLANPPPGVIVVQSKGEFVGGGVTGIVERLPSGDVVKTPLEFPDDPGLDCARDITIEAEIYQMLGEHSRLVKLRSWDPVQHELVLEYMQNGTLKQYIRDHLAEITPQLRIRWARQAVEGLQLLHAADLELKIADFGGSSVNGSRASVCPGIRYKTPDLDWRKPPTLAEDLFSLGSLFYFIFTGNVPFHDLEEEEVEDKFRAGVFPDLSGVPCADIIALCWKQAR
ncbi:L-type lectin-domain containing receptor kinase S-like protein [Hapsidospora chrysogenum ATCC 11550]|uniref:L-type lectin-domain containing receptor kinase S-like protein n=1 Tax=Hapsidospora chrysogenum (strain ATCC 11550 / CBS 779.69 / DSM 880 / IAM 14645 / JCM 23072 / IMI 49137) TaxID=857340 RepID=A0A086T6U5_HAPC1|nr:L-type lectin-domain containing receptor kinase S-like protein [Hapsidospora chrysogenum ATCC 11550]